MIIYWKNHIGTFTGASQSLVLGLFHQLPSTIGAIVTIGVVKPVLISNRSRFLTLRRGP